MSEKDKLKKKPCIKERETLKRKYKCAMKRSRQEMKQTRKERQGTEINSLQNGKKRQCEKKRNTQRIKCMSGKENKYTKKEYRKKTV